MLKKLSVLFLTAVTFMSCFILSTPAFAATDCSKVPSSEYQKCISNPNNYDSTKTPNAAFTGTCRSGFLGLTSWDCNVDISNEASLKTGIWQIAANIATDITIIAAYLVLGYVIYGGYLYMFSYGDPSKVANGKKTLTQAFIGLAIVMSAYVIMSTIRFVLIGASGNLANCATEQCVDANTLITSSIQWFIGIAGVVAAIFILYGGISYVTSAGDPNKLQKAKQVITYALIGLVIVGIAELITAFISNMIRNADNQAYFNQTIISKEIHEKQIH